jgi:MycE methyltransferase N-terminal
MSIDHPLVESVLLAASLPDAEISARVAEIGPDRVAQVMLDEVACRAALLDDPADKLKIQCDLGFADGRLAYLLVFGNGRVRVENGWDIWAAASLRQDLVDMLRELFGPPGRHGVTRELRNTQSEAPLGVDPADPVSKHARRSLPGCGSWSVRFRSVRRASPTSPSGLAQTSGATIGTRPSTIGTSSVIAS